MRPSTAARLAMGTACLGAPGLLLRSVGAPDQDDPRARTVTRVLGLRLTGQGLLDLRRRDRSHDLDIGVELTHAASMLPVAALGRTHRRAASVSAAMALALAVTDLVERPR